MNFLVSHYDKTIFTSNHSLIKELLKYDHITIKTITDNQFNAYYAKQKIINDKSKLIAKLGIQDETINRKTKQDNKSVQKHRHLIKDGTKVHRFNYYVYTDGGYRYRNGHGAWAYAVYDGDYQEIKTDSAGSFGGASNNKMEISALIRSLQYLIQINATDKKILITSDSKYLINSVTKWLDGWQKNGWKRSDGKLKNAELWQQLYQLIPQFSNLYIRWTKGHDHNHGNIEVDHLLNETMNRMEQS